MKQYELTGEQNQMLEKSFMAIPSRDGWEDKFLKINEKLAQTAKALTLITPDSPEQKMAIVKLREVGFWFEQAIRKNEF